MIILKSLSKIVSLVCFLVLDGPARFAAPAYNQLKIMLLRWRI
jgi:hypothetical protein